MVRAPGGSSPPCPSGWFTQGAPVSGLVATPPSVCLSALYFPPSTIFLPPFPSLGLPAVWEKGCSLWEKGCCSLPSFLPSVLSLVLCSSLSLSPPECAFLSGLTTPLSPLFPCSLGLPCFLFSVQGCKAAADRPAEARALTSSPEGHPAHSPSVEAGQGGLGLVGSTLLLAAGG